MKYRKTILSLLLSVLPLLLTSAPTVYPAEDLNGGWYAGLRGGILPGVCTFVSAGDGNTFLGWTTGVFGGYRFTSALSLEAAFRIGQALLAVRDNDVKANYWLGEDNVCYHAPVIDMEGWEYNRLKSRVDVRRLSLQLNVDLLSLLPLRGGRWRAELSPVLSLLNTRAAFVNFVTGHTVERRTAQWHWGAGGEGQVSYRTCARLDVGVYAAFTRVGGGRYDGIPVHLYKANELYEVGVKLTWNLRRESKARRGNLVPQSSSLQWQAASLPETSADTTLATTGAELEPLPGSAETLAAGIPGTHSLRSDSARLTVFPVVYFEFDSSEIIGDEERKMWEILALLQANPDMSVSITGWCDTVGSAGANRRTSLRRAEALKCWLVLRGVQAERIETTGAGSDYEAESREAARRSETTEIKEKKQ